MEKKINIMCLYWEGDFRGRNFTPEDVWRLFKQVEEHLTLPHTFNVLTNNVRAHLPGVKLEMKNPDLPGWWGKMELHRLDLPYGQTLYMDLDTTILRNMDKVFDVEGDLVMFKNRAVRGMQKQDGKLVVFRYQAAIMLFNNKKSSFIYNRFIEDPEKYMKEFRSDQDLMGKWIPNQPTFPDEWMMKLSKVKERHLIPKDTIFVTGQPKNKDFRKL